ncbi:MAG TPA: outer membrane protein assembly factor BamD [Deltaproteobacteria bacterium]|nr:outer membrane protein assembly factor BamD [Deltaproteobacteria bacterium]
MGSVIIFCAAVLSTLSTPSSASSPEVPSPEVLAGGEEILAVDGALRGLALPLSEAVIEALRLGAWEDALQLLRAMDPATLPGGTRGDWAFLVAWCAAHGDAPERAADVLPWLDEGTSAPESHAAWVRGEILRAVGDAEAALSWLDRVEPGSSVHPSASVSAIETLRALGRGDEAWARVEAVAARPDPVLGNEAALLALAQREGRADAEIAGLLRRLWTYYPDTPEGAEAEVLLGEHIDHPPTWQQVALRAERLMNAEAYDQALAETAPYESHADEATLDGCRLRYVRGRSAYKRNRLSDSVAELSGIGEQCVDTGGTYGQRGLYILGTAQFRRKRFIDSAEAYRRLATLYPEHSMADDAWTRGGISLLEGGQPGEAEAWWGRALEDHPEGDTVPEATLRLAFARYDAGDTATAIEVAERLAALSPAGNADNVQAGRYWAARWRLYPDADAPRSRTSDPAAREEAIARLRDLCEELPHSFYAILAYSRLLEEAPPLAEALARRPDDHDDGSTPRPWQIRLSVLTDPAVRDAVALMRLALSTEALQTLRGADIEWTADEKAWLTELRIAAGDWLLAHDDLRSWIHHHPLTTLGPREAQVIRVAYPDRYWEEVQASVPDSYHYEPRLLHGLVREESNFNRQIISFAGAIGLSQLMWKTAQQTAGWLDLSITRESLEDPATNLKIGGRYLEAMHRQLSGSPYLSLAAYNGGARNVNKWVDENDNPPTDEWVERIPYRETRGYVKRVMGTWQTMRYQFDDADAFYDLSEFNQRARP